MNDTIPLTIQEMHAALENKMIEILVILEDHYKRPMPIPRINLVPRLGLHLGHATRLDNSVTLNQDLCFNEKYWNEQLNVTLPHEICHLVAPVIYSQWNHGFDKRDGWGHGRAWKECMRVVGLPPERTCGNLDREVIQSLRIRTRRVVQRGYIYECPCGKTFNLTSTLHNRILEGRYRVCRDCKGRLLYKGQKMGA